MHGFWGPVASIIQLGGLSELENAAILYPFEHSSTLGDVKIALTKVGPIAQSDAGWTLQLEMRRMCMR
jgi:hypothetical protein